jgi:tRNA-specific 2-thiouridylase
MSERKSTVKDKFVVGITGGVDSAIAAFLLKKQGHDCIGVSLIMMDPDTNAADQDLLNGCQIKKIEQAKDVCAQLEIPFFAVNAFHDFKHFVADPYIASRLVGEEFLPCFSCNVLKMKILWEKAQKLGANRIATGHFAKVRLNQSTKDYQVFSANDRENDQSHLLSTLNQEFLAVLTLPLGDIRRQEVMALQERFKLPVQPRPNRQEFCFYKKPQLTEYIQKNVHEILRPEGSIIQDDNEGHLGEHLGLYSVRIGQDNVTSTLTTSNIDKTFKIGRVESAINNIYLKPTINQHLSFSLNHFLQSGERDFSRPKKVLVKFFDSTKYYKGQLFYKTNSYVDVLLEESVTGLIFQQNVVILTKTSGSYRVLGSGQICDLGLFTNLHRAEEVADRETDDDGNTIPMEGKDFGF